MHTFERLEPRRHLDGGDPDIAFGDNGVATIDYEPLVDSADTGAWGSDVTQDRNGYVVVAGRDSPPVGDTGEIYVTRVTPLGEPDASFGAGGTQTLPRRFADSPEIHTNSAGQVYVRDRTVITRLTSRGKIDATFGNRGKVKIPLLDSPDFFALDEQGRIYVYGSDDASDNPLENSPRRMTAVRLTPAGKLDTDWGNLGRFQPPLQDGHRDVDNRGEFMREILLLDDGRVLFAGYGSFNNPGLSTGSNYLITMRLNADGTPDTTYGRGGFNVLRKDSTSKVGWGVQPLFFFGDGSLMAYQEDFHFTQPRGTRERLNVLMSADGRSIERFDFLTQPTQDELDLEILKAAFPQPDGKVITRFDGGVAGDRLARLNSDGNIDRTWADSGVLQLPVGAFEEYRIANDGSLLVLKSPLSTITSASTTVSRFWNDDRPIATANAKDVTAPHGGSIAIRVTWRDDDGIDDATISSRDLAVEQPDGSRRSVRFASATPQSDGSIFATYKLSSADGNWSAADSGRYRIFSRGAEVTDINGVKNLTAIVVEFLIEI